MSSESEIRNLLKAREQAIASGDAAGALAALASDVVVFDLAPPLQYEGAQARDNSALERWFDTWNGAVTVSLEAPTIVIDGDLAVVFGLQHMRGDKKDVGPLDQWSRSTVILKRQGGAWTIVHEHVSFPMKMNGSGEAATDLLPAETLRS